jgi:protein-S-isoprenylcysteine O-methyltransferase Ste14
MRRQDAARTRPGAGHRARTAAATPGNLPLASASDDLMNDEFRLCFSALYGVGPVVAVLALLRRGLGPSTRVSQVKGWRWYIPPLLLPVEWLLPPVLIFLGVGEIQAGGLLLRLVGLTIGLGGVVLLTWASLVLGRFLIHEAAVLPGHILITSGPYRFVRHPVYAGYLLLLLGSGVGTLNVWLLLLWPVSLVGILIQARAEEQLLEGRFGQDYESYVCRTGRIVPRFRFRFWS